MARRKHITPAYEGEPTSLAAFPVIDETRVQGTIVRVNPKGFGFIKAEGVSTDIFFHATSISRNWDMVYEGLTVSFSMATTDKGLRAEQVTVEQA